MVGLTTSKRVVSVVDLQRYHNRDELVVPGDDVAALQADQGNGAVEQAEAVGTQEVIPGLDVTGYAGRRWLQTTKLDVLERDVEFGLFRITAVDGGGGVEVNFLPIDSPGPRPVADHSTAGECSRFHGLLRPHRLALLRHHGSPPIPDSRLYRKHAGGRVACLSRALPLARGESRDPSFRSHCSIAEKSAQMLVQTNSRQDACCISLAGRGPGPRASDIRKDLLCSPCTIHPAATLHGEIAPGPQHAPISRWAEGGGTGTLACLGTAITFGSVAPSRP